MKSIYWFYPFPHVFFTYNIISIEPIILLNPADITPVDVTRTSAFQTSVSWLGERQWIFFQRN